jgi:DNA-binding MarR family transcriptional regulator
VASTPSDDRVQAWDVFRSSHAQVKAAISADLDREREMQLAWFDVLHALNSAGGRLRMQDLSATLFMNKSSLTRLVDRIEADGLISREADPADGRGTLAALTKVGRERYRSVKPVYLRAIQRHFGAALADADVANVQRALTKLVP